MKVYDDCIMLWNDGKLPEGIDQEKLFEEHASQPRNRNIANAFYKAGFIGTWGRGINKIRQGLKKEGLPEPKIENHVSGTLITIYRNVGVNVGINNTYGTINGINGTNNDINDTNNVGVNVGEKLTIPQRDIYELVKGNRNITIPQMADHFQVSIRTLKRDIAELQKIGIIQRKGNTKNASWIAVC